MDGILELHRHASSNIYRLLLEIKLLILNFLICKVELIVPRCIAAGHISHEICKGPDT